MISTASSTSDAELFDHLAHGPLHWFREWPNAEVPPFGAGVYTVWDDAGTLIYVGMSGRTITIDTQPRTKPYGLYTRLASHAGGRRSGDQFCVYVADRLVLPSLTAEQVRLIGAGALEFDALDHGGDDDGALFRPVKKAAHPFAGR